MTKPVELRAVQVVVILAVTLVVLVVVKTLAMVPIVRMGVVANVRAIAYLIAELLVKPNARVTVIQLVQTHVLPNALQHAELAVAPVVVHRALQQIVKTFPSIGVYK